MLVSTTVSIPIRDLVESSYDVTMQVFEDTIRKAHGVSSEYVVDIIDWIPESYTTANCIIFIVVGDITE